MKTVEYNESFGAVNFPEGFSEKLAGKGLEEQMSFYRIIEGASFSRTAYGETTGERSAKNTYMLADYPELTGLVIRDGMIVGVLIKAWPFNRDEVCLPYECVCTYFASDNEGSGTKDRADYARLICI